MNPDPGLPESPPSPPPTASPPPTEAPAPASSEPHYLSRDIQWVRFNERVLQQALDDRTPLLERVRFLAIFASNLDEFFMKRVGGLRRQQAAGVLAPADLPMGTDILQDIRDAVVPLLERKHDCFVNELRPALRKRGVELLNFHELEPTEAHELQDWYRSNVFPVLTPLAVDPGHRFPFISNLSTSLGVMLRRPDAPDEPLFARVKVPQGLDQWHRVGSSLRFVRLLEVIEQHLPELFPGMEILEVLPFRVTRNADIEGDSDDVEDLLEEIQQQLRSRRFAPVVRMQVGRAPSPRLMAYLAEEMEIEARDIYHSSGLINYSALHEIADLPIPELRYAPWVPVTPARLQDKDVDIFSTIRAGDLLVHHPYESFGTSVERFVDAAARDPNVLAIKQALYRTSGDSPFVHALIRAAESGKQVAVLVELRARFDEEANIQWAQKLEDAGVHVAHGVVGLKTHSKITLVVRREAGGVRCYCHIGTGNYHSRTAKLYEDIGLFTTQPDIVEDVVHLFNAITGRSRSNSYNRLLVAPTTMAARFVEMIGREADHHRAGRPASIIAKMNQLQDPEIIEALYAASAAGVPVDLIVRGFCTLRPGVPGLSDNIRVIAAVGRFLEHSRIFHFRNGQTDPLDGEFYIGSADWMYRNLHNRVEATCPIDVAAHRQRLWTILQLCLDDRRLAWDMQPDGTYIQRRPEGVPEDAPEAIGAQQALMNLAREAREE